MPSLILFPSTLSLSKPLSSLSPISPAFGLTHLPIQPCRRLLPPIRMGGGPRTFPGGVSKWQWKRMQANKAKQLLKARLARERQIYEMRKRAELRAAVAELEKPWELVQQAPVLFSVAADEQVKALADRFQRPGGFDMWSDRDGPMILRRSDGGELVVGSSGRFFPKGVVHSVKPYGAVDDWISRGGGGVGGRRRRRRRDGGKGDGGSGDEEGSSDLEVGGGTQGVRRNGDEGESPDFDAGGGNVGSGRGFRGNGGRGRGRGRGGRWSNEVDNGLRAARENGGNGGRGRGRGGERPRTSNDGRSGVRPSEVGSDRGWSRVRDLRRGRQLGEK